MVFFHLSDLHIGRLLHGYSLYEEQKHMLDEIVCLIREKRPDAVVIAGDIFDKSVPSAEAYKLFDGFLNALADIEPNVPAMIIAGNHDSAQRLEYASSFLARNRIYIASFPPMSADEHIQKVTLEDACGEVDFYLLPFTKPEHVRRMMAESMEKEQKDNEEELVAEKVSGLGYEQAVRWLMEREEIDYSRRNVLVSHQFYTHGSEKPQSCESEQIRLSVGGIDQIDTETVKAFDYVALGHIHGAQNIGSERIRYSGTPLKYSISEERHQKSVTVVTLLEKGGDIGIETIPLQPLRDVRSIRGELEQVIADAKEPSCHDYVSITLTDEFEQFHARDKLLEVYDHILEIKVDNARTRAVLYDNEEMEEEESVEEAFAQFYEQMLQTPMSEEEAAYMKDIFTQIGEEM